MFVTLVMMMLLLLNLIQTYQYPVVQIPSRTLYTSGLPPVFPEDSAGTASLRFRLRMCFVEQHYDTDAYVLMQSMLMPFLQENLLHRNNR